MHKWCIAAIGCNGYLQQMIAKRPYDKSMARSLDDFVHSFCLSKPWISRNYIVYWSAMAEVYAGSLESSRCWFLDRWKTEGNRMILRANLGKLNLWFPEKWMDFSHDCHITFTRCYSSPGLVLHLGLPASHLNPKSSEGPAKLCQCNAHNGPMYASVHTQWAQHQNNTQTLAPTMEYRWRSLLDELTQDVSAAI